MPQDLNSFDKALKDFYGVGLKESINNSSPILTEATKNTTDFVGRDAVWALHSSRSASTSARGDGGTLATAGNQEIKQLKERVKYLYHTIKVTGPAKHLSKGDNGAFARALEVEIDGAEKDLKNDVARQVAGQSVVISGTAYSGVLATVTNYASSVVTIAGATAAELRYFFVGETLAFFTTAGSYAATGTVSAVNAAIKTITLTGVTGTPAQNHHIVRGDSTSSNNWGNEINGLRHLVNATSVFAGQDPTATPTWAAQTAGSPTTQISETLIDQAAEAVETDGDGSTPTLYLVEHLQRRKLAQQMQAQKTYEGRELTLTAGWRGLQVARGTLVADRYIPVNDAFAITPKYLQHFVALDWTWDDDDGKVLFKTTTADAVEARFKTYQNLAVTVRNAHTRITLSTPSF